MRKATALYIGKVRTPPIYTPSMQTTLPVCSKSLYHLQGQGDENVMWGGRVCRWAPKDVAVTTLLPVYLALAGTGGGERQRRASRRTP